MKITDKLIREIAELAKLDFDKNSAEQMKADLEKIIGLIKPENSPIKSKM